MTDRLDEARIGAELAEQRPDAKQRPRIAALDRLGAKKLRLRMAYSDRRAALVFAANPPQPCGERQGEEVEILPRRQAASDGSRRTLRGASALTRSDGVPDRRIGEPLEQGVLVGGKVDAPHRRNVGPVSRSIRAAMMAAMRDRPSTRRW